MAPKQGANGSPSSSHHHCTSAENSDSEFLVSDTLPTADSATSSAGSVIPACDVSLEPTEFNSGTNKRSDSFSSDSDLSDDDDASSDRTVVPDHGINGNDDNGGYMGPSVILERNTARVEQCSPARAIHHHQNVRPAHERDSSTLSSAESFEEVKIQGNALSRSSRTDSGPTKHISSDSANHYHHHPRGISRTSSIPSTPSPLGPGHFTDALNSDVSGLVPSPARQAMRQASEPTLRQNIFTTKLKQLTLSEKQKMEKRGSPDPQQNHRHQSTDPFTDRSTPITEAPPNPHSAPDHKHEYTQASPTAPPPSFTPYHTRPRPAPHTSPAPIPPFTPSQLPPDAHLASRQSWIQRSASSIASLARALTTAEQTFHSTRTPRSLAALRLAIDAFAHATDLNARIEERRMLFMPRGMRVLRTGEGGRESDGFGGGEGEGRLLGGEMAVMERVGVEVLRGVVARRRGWGERG